MIRGIKQNDAGLDERIRKYGCLFLCFAYSSPLVFEGEEGRTALNHIWKIAVEKGYITDDLNGDGDVDDSGEAEIVNHTALARDLFALEIKYDGVHHKAWENIPDKVLYVFGKYVWKGGHFVVLSRQKNVVFDSYGKSNTVANGKLESMRWYYAD